jgi:hypothetical protein
MFDSRHIIGFPGSTRTADVFPLDENGSHPGLCERRSQRCTGLTGTDDNSVIGLRSVHSKSSSRRSPFLSRGFERPAIPSVKRRAGFVSALEEVK